MSPSGSGPASARANSSFPAAACSTSACSSETIRREGGELAVGKPKVIVKEVNGHKQEPFEDLVVEVPTST